ncbi:MAG TPA: phage tail tip lysozyme [Lactovum miscens]|uniref:phage tail tip lysozyme n=1 Tax=Lactovum miscens TaxID=190387 RepID=UPI002EDA73F2
MSEKKPNFKKGPLEGAEETPEAKTEETPSIEGQADISQKSFQGASRLAMLGKQQLRWRAKSAIMNKTFGGEDILQEGMRQHGNYRQAKMHYRIAKSFTKHSVKFVSSGGRHSYGAVNRSYNYIRGRGFVRTPEEFKGNGRKQLAKNLRNAQMRFKAARESKKAEEGLSYFRALLMGNEKKGLLLKVILTNPFTYLFFVAILMFMIFSTISLMSQAPIKQDDFQLSDSWTEMTKLDAEHSDSGNSFFTPIDNIMYFMNNQFDDYTITDNLPASSSNSNKTYQDYVTTLWGAINGASPDYKITNLSSLEKDKSSDYYIDSDDLSDLNDRINQIGYQELDHQLSFPYGTTNLIITRRYGDENVDGKIQLNNSIETPVMLGQTIVAPMTGTIESINSASSLTLLNDKNARLTLSGVTTSRFWGGEVVPEGSLLGQATGNNLSIRYEVYDSSSKTYKTVNPGFYFPAVTYTQFTTLASDKFNPDAAMASRAQAFYDYFSKLGYTKAGICAILGNLQVESSIDSKRAEGDYLAPPVGATDSSWDDPAWLAMGGPDIYNGDYPNIVHRGLGYGQWTDTSDGGTRHTMLLNYASAKGKKWYDAELQMDFMLNGDVPGAQVVVRNTASAQVDSTVAGLTVYFLNNWEGNPGNKVQLRVTDAQNWYNYFTSKEAGQVTSGDAVFQEYKDRVQATLGSLPSDEVISGNPYPGNTSPTWQCVFYAFNRARQLGIPVPSTSAMGNGGQWAGHYMAIPGATVSHTPQAGDIASSYSNPFASGDQYGHVAIVEFVNPDGSYVVSEESAGTPNSYEWRVLPASTAQEVTFIHVSK